MTRFAMLLRRIANWLDLDYKQAKRAYLAGVAANPNARPTLLTTRPDSDLLLRGRRAHWWSPMRYEVGHYVGDDGHWEKRA